MSNVLQFAPFVRGGSTVLIALWSESGGGKSRSALELAKGLAGEAGKIIVVDTENGRARHYAPTPPDPRILYAELPPRSPRSVTARRSTRSPRQSPPSRSST